MSEKEIEKWLLSGRGGFEGTPEASTFTFHGLVSMIDAYVETECDGMRAELEKDRHAFAIGARAADLIIKERDALKAQLETRAAEAQADGEIISSLKADVERLKLRDEYLCVLHERSACPDCLTEIRADRDRWRGLAEGLAEALSRIAHFNSAMPGMARGYAEQAIAAFDAVQKGRGA